jgi:hypothetical protein
MRKRKKRNDIKQLNKQTNKSREKIKKNLLHSRKRKGQETKMDHSTFPVLQLGMWG